MLDKVRWFGHAGFIISGSLAIAIDPYQIDSGEMADIILITHDHYDHLSPDDIGKIRGDETEVVLPRGAETELTFPVHRVDAGEKITLKGVEIEAVAAYNIGKAFHAREKGHVGYVFQMDGVTYYHAGDTDRIPEMKTIRTDVAFLPVGGTYTMGAEEAAAAATDIGPVVAVPMHWGTIIGSKKDAERFVSAYPGKSFIMEKI